MQTEPVFAAAVTRPTLLIEDDRSDDPLRWRIVVAGELGTTGGAELHRAVLTALRRYQPRCIEIDTRGLISVDPQGLVALLLCRQDAQQVDCRLAVKDPHPRTYQILREAGLADAFGLPR